MLIYGVCNIVKTETNVETQSHTVN